MASKKSGNKKRKQNIDIRKLPGGDTLFLYQQAVKRSSIRLSKDALTEHFSDHSIMLQTCYDIVMSKDYVKSKIRVIESLIGCEIVFLWSDGTTLIPYNHFNPRSRCYRYFLCSSGLPTVEDAVEAGGYKAPLMPLLEDFELLKPRWSEPGLRFEKKALYIRTGSERVTPKSPILRKLKMRQNLKLVDHIYIGRTLDLSGSNGKDIYVIVTSVPSKQTEDQYYTLYDNYNKEIISEPCKVTDLSGGARAMRKAKF